MTAPTLKDWPTIESAVRRIAAFDPATDAGSIAAVDAPTLRDALRVLAAQCADLDDGPDVSTGDSGFDAAVREWAAQTGATVRRTYPPE